MAKKNPEKQKIQIPQEINNQVQDVIHNKKEKEGGKRFVLNEKYRIPGYLMPLQKDGVLIECNDGYYKVITNLGTEQPYRLKGESYLNKMSVSEVSNSD
jgi:hypothetical protein